MIFHRVPASLAQFDVLLAHNSQDKPQVRAIANELKQRGLKLWLDEEQILRPGSSFQQEILQAIPLVKTAAIFIGVKTLGRWQVLELESLVQECVENNIHIIPVLLPDVSMIPENLRFLRRYRFVSFLQQVSDVEALNLLEWGITGRRPERKLEPNQVIQTNVIKTDDLSSDKAVDYTRLRNLLKAGEWKEADAETLGVILKAFGREAEAYLDYRSINNFPCTDLRTIDQLWVKYSNGRFGFSVQKRIWESVGGNPYAILYEIFEHFGDRVGWRVEKDWIDNEGVNFSTSAPEGHLPYSILEVHFQMETCFFSRAKTCKV
ncbi:GUN4 domain-containing protein [Nostoc sp.]|uniref:GUN4 domain-containing protein n=1 Tax=Nostoc sp. TaxID=1180 RepID=UPI002FFD0E63